MRNSQSSQGQMKVVLEKEQEPFVSEKSCMYSKEWQKGLESCREGRGKDKLLEANRSQSEATPSLLSHPGFERVPHILPGGTGKRLCKTAGGSGECKEWGKSENQCSGSGVTFQPMP